ncbi:magnesium/cobalt transporter CorA [Vibrio cholerae]|uniref:magnesium/cobalt transporter CorA n=1 Tax=Vibrio cholerae TaxID=666 RepID=UPI001D2D7707|nr:magnesium/cobalt transporter CorA [Vibrio cholerae]EJI1277651.1 magnesium/cobalt transporter CorA [Vibrio vulnificus]EGR1127118.1 magnesium/cobalt transporter CorA [Vibrio cholerae]EGR2121039.1 magnesium/cobalt transporter CorA [Vibrio cholerae]EGR2126651.1 magnesium/cobalt transporter CorA [Vibrio cholerae]EJL6292062.1 magnesium/cobalt transporter CorA [Vibrio cholerae]
MLRFFNIINGVITTIADDDKHDLNQLVAQADWIDAHEPTDEERELISSLLRIELPESEDVEEIETSARCFIDTAGIHVHSLFLSPTEGRHNTVTVACILQNKRLITIREGDVADFRLLRLRARKGQIRCDDVDSLLVTLLEQKVENHADTLEDIHRQLEKVSHDVLENDDADLEECISRLARLEDSNGKVRLCLMDTQRDISFLLRHLKSRNDHRETLSEISRDIEALMSHTTFLFDKINFLMDSTQGFINIEQNQIIKIFSIAAVVFLPPTVIASIYGMNFDFMPELHWLGGYPWALGLMLASGFAPYFYFKRKGWL